MNTFSFANKRDLIIIGDARTGAFREAKNTLFRTSASRNSFVQLITSI